MAKLGKYSAKKPSNSIYFNYRPTPMLSSYLGLGSMKVVVQSMEHRNEMTVREIYHALQENSNRLGHKLPITWKAQTRRALQANCAFTAAVHRCK
jgi:hypothetical protein